MRRSGNGRGAVPQITDELPPPHSSLWRIHKIQCRKIAVIRIKIAVPCFKYRSIGRRMLQNNKSIKGGVILREYDNAIGNSINRLVWLPINIYTVMTANLSRDWVRSSAGIKWASDNNFMSMQRRVHRGECSCGCERHHGLPQDGNNKYRQEF